MNKWREESRIERAHTYTWVCSCADYTHNTNTHTKRMLHVVCMLCAYVFLVCLRCCCSCHAMVAQHSVRMETNERANTER